MSTTKERIRDASLRTFARDGYEAVSTSAIASELGMTKSALYKHFPDKRAIFDSLVDRMLERHKSAAAGSALAKNADADPAQAYAAMTPEDMAALGEALFSYWTLDDSAVAFRRMLSLERFRNERIARTYDELFITGPLSYNEALFDDMIAIGALDPGDAAQMALDFWAPIYLLMQATDNGMGTKKALAAVRKHVLEFADTHARSSNG